MSDHQEIKNNSYPKLPDNYWEMNRNDNNRVQNSGIFDYAVKVSLNDITNQISIFHGLKGKIK